MSLSGTTRDLRAAASAEGVPDEHLPFCLEGGPDAFPVLLMHGAGGSPDDLRHLGEFLAAAGHSVFCPLLPGHGRGPVELGDVPFSALVEAVVRSYDVLAAEGRPVAVVAQSLGAVLTVQLAVRRPVARFAALAPALRPFVFGRIWLLGVLALFNFRLAQATYRWNMQLLRGIRETRRIVPDVTCPLLVLHSDDDRSVRPAGGRELHERAGSAEKQLVTMDGQGHVLSRAPDRERLVYEPVLTFLTTAAEA